MELSPFEKKCLALNIGYDHTVCNGRHCEHRMTCVRYMLHTKANLEGYGGALYYIDFKFNFLVCYKKYE